MKFIRIFLLILIVVGIGLLLAQNLWVPSFVNWILIKENSSQVIQKPIQINNTSGTTTTTTTTNTTSTKPPLPKPPATGTLLGTVTLSPVCPVERIPPDPQCAPKPYATLIKVERPGNTTAVASVESKSDGSFKFVLAPGMYVITATGGTTYPRCSAANIQVVSGTSKTIVIACDTGIR